MIYTLTLNPSLDYISKIKEIKFGEVNRSYQEDVFAGGKGINVSTILKELGNDSAILGFIAGFTGQEIERRIDQKKIKHQLIYLEEGFSRINIKIKSQQETEINAIGPSINQTSLTKLFSILDGLVNQDVLVLSGSIPPSLSNTIYQQIMKHIQPKNISIIVDATGDLLLNTLPYHPFLIKPNIHELEEIIGYQLKKEKQIIDAIHHLQEKGARNVLVSLGKDGALLMDESKNIYHRKAPSGKLVNSTGAGDSMVAGFIHGYLINNNFDDAINWGVACGSATAFSLDLANKKEIVNIYQKLTYKY